MDRLPSVAIPALLGSLLAISSAFQLHSPTLQSSHHVTPSRIPSHLFSTEVYKVDVSEDTERNADGFLEWASYYGASPENFQINIDPESNTRNNWGAFTTQDGLAGERAVFVPSMLRITSQNAREQDFAEQEPQISDAIAIDSTYTDGDTDIPLACHFYLFLKVLQEYEVGTDSAYYSWMDALPRSFNTALTFTEFEMDCLPPFVKLLAFKDRENYERFLYVLDSLDTPTISDSIKQSEEITTWAFNVVFTRARAAFGEAEIIPLADMMNHNANPNAEVQYDEEGNAHVMLLQDVGYGEQLFKCYGQPTNPSRYLATYGFFDTSPPATYCKLFPDLATKQELKNMGFGYDRLVFYPEDGSIASEVWDAVLFMNLITEGADQETQQAFYNSHMQGDDETKAQIHELYAAQTCASLLKHVEETIEELDTCEYIMNSGGLGLTHKNIAMISRHNEFVQETFAKVKANLENIQAGLQ